MRSFLNKSGRLYILLFLLLFCSNAAFSQKVDVKAHIDSSHIYLGDPIKYNLEITYDKSLKVFLPVFPDSFQGFVVLDRSKIDSSAKENIITKKQTITLTTFDSGDKYIPAMKIGYLAGGSKMYSFISTDSFKIIVNYVPVDTTLAIKPIKGILKAPVSFRELLPYILIVIALVLIALAVLYYIKRLRSDRPLFVRPKPVIPPHVIALEKLKKLEDTKLWQKGEIKKFHIELTDIIREYMESRYGMLAIESTTPEILEQITSFVDDKYLIEKLKDFLELSDLVKFAKLTPLPDENEKCLRVSYDFVDQTKLTEPDTISNN